MKWVEYLADDTLDEIMERAQLPDWMEPKGEDLQKKYVLWWDELSREIDERINAIP